MDVKDLAELLANNVPISNFPGAVSLCAVDSCCAHATNCLRLVGGQRLYFCNRHYLDAAHQMCRHCRTTESTPA